MEETNWEEHYLEGHTPWDKGKAAPPLEEWLVANPATLSGKVLVPGCGLGHDARLLAKTQSGLDVQGIDLAPTAVAAARALSNPENLCFSEGNLFELEPAHRAAYAWIWEHTCFCAISPSLRVPYVEAVWNALTSGGTLLAVFYMDPYDEEHSPGEGPPHGVTKDELQSLFVESNRFAWEEKYIPTQSYPGRENRELVARMRKLD